MACSTSWKRARRRASPAEVAGQYAYQERKNLSTEFRLGEGLVGQCALEKQTHPDQQRAAGLHPGHLRVGASAAAQHRRAAHSVRGRRAGVVELASSSASAPSTDFPRPVDREHRHRAQHHPGQHAHEELLTQSRPCPRSCKTSRRNCGRPTKSWRRKPLLSDQKAEVERKNSEVEIGKRELEEKARSSR